MSKSAMQNESIQTEHEHRTAVSRIEQLMSALPSTADANELDMLATLVDAHEAEHRPVDTPDPDDAKQLRMEQQR